MLRRAIPSLVRAVPQRPASRLPTLYTRPLAGRIHTSVPRRHPSSDPGGKPNDGSHPTVYDDFHNILDSATRPSLAVYSTTDRDFTLADGLVLTTPLMLLNNHVFMWNCPPLDAMKATPGGMGWEGWEKEEVWKVLEMVDDRPEILLFGTGKTVLPPPGAVRKRINDLGIQLDVQNTRDACSTFNMLAEEGRKVAAALLPPIRSPITKVSPRELQKEEDNYFS